jgi:hypothetical protein
VIRAKAIFGGRDEIRVGLKRKWTVRKYREGNCKVLRRLPIKRSREMLQ